FTKSPSISVICAVIFCLPHGRDFFRRREWLGGHIASVHSTTSDSTNSPDCVHFMPYFLALKRIDALGGGVVSVIFCVRLTVGLSSSGVNRARRRISLASSTLCRKFGAAVSGSITGFGRSVVVMVCNSSLFLSCWMRAT